LSSSLGDSSGGGAAATSAAASVREVLAGPVAASVREAYLCLSLNDGVCRMMGISGFLGKRLCYINEPRKQYIPADIIFNYICHFGLPGTCLYLSPPTYLSGAGEASARKVHFPDLSKDMFLEVPKMNKCS
jgi:hypothetical protein